MKEMKRRKVKSPLQRRLITTSEKDSKELSLNKAKMK